VSCAIGLKWSGAVGCISPLSCTGGQGRVVGWDSVSGSPVRWGVWSIPSPNIFGSDVVRCGVSSDPTVLVSCNRSLLPRADICNNNYRFRSPT